jgi:hypothetical protein
VQKPEPEQKLRTLKTATHNQSPPPSAKRPNQRTKEPKQVPKQASKPRTQARTKNKDSAHTPETKLFYKNLRF